MKRNDLTRYLAEYLQVDNFSDYCPNGLQVEGRADVRKIATGVTASVATIQAAVDCGADTLIVHHGIIWKGANPTYIGGYRERVRLLLEHNINLYGYHLPLDAHGEVGNNVQLAQLLELKDLGPFGEYKGMTLGIRGDAGGIRIAELTERVRIKLQREPIVIDGGPARIHSVGMITGGAQGELTQALAAGLDAYITGECSEMNTHQAREEGIHFIAAGHHATERGGPRALGQHLAAKHGLEAEFLDLPNPI